MRQTLPKEGHLLLLRLAVAVADDVVVLLLDLVQLDLELDNLICNQSAVLHTAMHNYTPSRSGSEGRA